MKINKILVYAVLVLLVLLPVFGIVVRTGSSQAEKSSSGSVSNGEAQGLDTSIFEKIQNTEDGPVIGYVRKDLFNAYIKEPNGARTVDGFIVSSDNYKIEIISPESEVPSVYKVYKDDTFHSTYEYSTDSRKIRITDFKGVARYKIESETYSFPKIIQAKFDSANINDITKDGDVIHLNQKRISVYDTSKKEYSDGTQKIKVSDSSLTITTNINEKTKTVEVKPLSEDGASIIYNTDNDGKIFENAKIIVGDKTIPLPKGFTKEALDNMVGSSYKDGFITNLRCPGMICSIKLSENGKTALSYRADKTIFVSDKTHDLGKMDISLFKSVNLDEIKENQELAAEDNTLVVKEGDKFIKSYYVVQNDVQVGSNFVNNNLKMPRTISVKKEDGTLEKTFEYSKDDVQTLKKAVLKKSSSWIDYTINNGAVDNTNYIEYTYNYYPISIVKDNNKVTYDEQTDKYVVKDVSGKEIPVTDPKYKELTKDFAKAYQKANLGPALASMYMTASRAKSLTSLFGMEDSWTGKDTIFGRINDFFTNGFGSYITGNEQGICAQTVARKPFSESLVISSETPGLVLGYVSGVKSTIIYPNSSIEYLYKLTYSVKAGKNKDTRFNIILKGSPDKAGYNETIVYTDISGGDEEVVSSEDRFDRVVITKDSKTPYFNGEASLYDSDYLLEKSKSVQAIGKNAVMALKSNNYNIICLRIIDSELGAFDKCTKIIEVDTLNLAELSSVNAGSSVTVNNYPQPEVSGNW